MAYQTTIKNKIVFCGIGLHTGKKAKIELLPAKEDSGIIFVKGKKKLKANLKNVFDAKFAITLKSNGFKVKTAEHLLAALFGLGVDNVICKISSKELPALDGSSLGFSSVIAKGKIIKLKKKRKEIQLKEKYFVCERDRYLIAKPYKGLKISYFVKFDHPKIGEQFKEIVLNRDSFLKEIAKARTFGWEKQVKEQKRLGLIKGANLSNAVFFRNKKIVNKEGLRFKDEVVRHKILDLTGVLALLPGRLNAHIIAFKSGHALDLKLLKKIMNS